jgi:hypothetical protein
MRVTLKLAHDGIDEPLHALWVHRPLADGDRDRPDQLLTVERRAPAGSLQNRQFAQLYPLEGGEPAAALRA